MGRVGAAHPEQDGPLRVLSALRGTEVRVCVPLLPLPVGCSARGRLMRVIAIADAHCRSGGPMQVHFPRARRISVDPRTAITD